MLPHPFDRFRSPSSFNKSTRTDGKHNECAGKGEAIKTHDATPFVYGCSKDHPRAAEGPGDTKFSPRWSGENGKSGELPTFPRVRRSTARPARVEH